MNETRGAIHMLLAPIDSALAGAARGSVKLLYVAPEKLLTPWLLAALRRLTISLWGHSFRPAYLRLGHVLRSVLRPRCVLGLTATATAPTAKEVAEVLGLAPGRVLREAPLRDNLRLRVLHMPGCTESGTSRAALLQLLRTELRDAASVLVYVGMQWQADEVARDLQSGSGIAASSYHAARRHLVRTR
ncbi:ATP-dependent DNA helicase recQ [Tetrabaena socialis]|uniref:ATP-dependent DNA helicase recQ n=1 Tax=Tetrabaena socialis TaxID=47790 RepID=A0A2J7ZQ30_9CHLO|nr:ATP-dependent DNA helicase recQ [Tetrabaena socialis]|eukprot:PNH02380.1 ATP-dependent DNA helicase recQ [Tetrabaena socialis]